MDLKRFINPVYQQEVVVVVVEVEVIMVDMGGGRLVVYIRCMSIVA